MVISLVDGYTRLYEGPAKYGHDEAYELARAWAVQHGYQIIEGA